MPGAKAMPMAITALNAEDPSAEMMSNANRSPGIAITASTSRITASSKAPPR